MGTLSEEEFEKAKQSFSGFYGWVEGAMRWQSEKILPLVEAALKVEENEEG